jgi:two-component system NtrC family sensor kinase
MSDSLTPQRRLLAWGRSLFALAVVAVHLVLGVANIAMRAQWHQVEDGVLWKAYPEGVRAAEVSAGSPAAAAGVARGDVLVAVNGSPVERPSDVIALEHAGVAGTRLSYTLVRLGSQQALEVTLAPSPHGSPMYFVLAAVGLFTLLVGASVRLRRPDDQATLHFFWLCVAFFGAFTFSFTGPLDRLDWIFYWGDAVSMALLPALLLHFTLEFPERPVGARPNLTLIAPLIYAPAVVLGAARIMTVTRASDGVMFSHSIDLIERGEHVYLFVAAAAALAVLVKAFRQITSETGQRQLRWIAWGTGLGVGPFAVFYALPWAVGVDPPLALQLTSFDVGVVGI